MAGTFNCGSRHATMSEVRNCKEREKPIRDRAWRVLQRYCNHSAFNGYHYTSSEWSTVRCLSCRAVGRTKANYVAELRDA